MSTPTITAPLPAGAELRPVGGSHVCHLLLGRRRLTESTHRQLDYVPARDDDFHVVGRVNPGSARSGEFHLIAAVDCRTRLVRSLISMPRSVSGSFYTDLPLILL